MIKTEEEERLILKPMAGKVYQLSLDSKGTHVVQKAINKFKINRLEFIYEEAFANLLELVNNNHGLCMIKKLLSVTYSSEKRATFMSLITMNSLDIMQNQYGNYAITEILSNWEQADCLPIYETVREKICVLSVQKYSSNVVERCLERADQETKMGLIEKFCHADKLASIIRNQFGNYVMQTSLQFSQGELRERLKQAIEKSIPQIPDRKIRQKWESILSENAAAH
jgi:hypothetical protein